MYFFQYSPFTGPSTRLNRPAYVLGSAWGLHDPLPPNRLVMQESHDGSPWLDFSINGETGELGGEGEGAMSKNPPMFCILFAYLNMQSAEWANLPGHVRETFSLAGGAWNLHNLPRNLISLCSERFCWS